MLEAGFIRPYWYAEWISSVVPVQKKDGRWRVCVDFRYVNRALVSPNDITRYSYNPYLVKKAVFGMSQGLILI
jgi:hypothetical protein